MNVTALFAVFSTLLLSAFSETPIVDPATTLSNAVPIPIGELADRPFRHNPEKLLFNVTYLGILGGYATMESTQGVNESGAPTQTFVLRAWTTPFVSMLYKLEMNLTAKVHPETLKTYWYNEDRHENQRHYFHIMDFAPDGKSYGYGTLRNGGTNYDKSDCPEPYHDVVTSFFVARCLDLSKINVKYTGFVHYHRNLYSFEVWVVAKKKIDTKWGKMDTVVIIPKMKFQGIFLNTGDIVIYISDDEYHCPVLMESQLSVGYFKSTLVDGYPGKKR